MPTGNSAIDAVIDLRSVSAVFQPIFDLRTMHVAGLEAFARGPAGSELESPGALFAAAAACGRTAELDWVCRAAAFRAALEAGLPPAMSVFVNAEPESLSAECPADLQTDVARAEAVLRVFVEVNDRALATDPAGLLAAADRAREMGWGIAIDDVGSGRQPITMMPVVHADLVKVDLGLLREADQADAAAVLLATLRHVERTGASLCVERIETEEDLRWARAIGAVYGQGRHLGAPGPLPTDVPAPRVPVPLVAASAGDAPVASPFELVPGAEPRRVERRHYLDLARAVAFGSISPGAAPVVLVGVGRGGFDPAVSATFPQGARPLLWAMFGTAMADVPVPWLRGVRVAATDPLADVEFLVVMTEKAGVALIGRSTPDGGLEIVHTQDREVAHAVARHLIRRVPPPGGDGVALPPPVGDLLRAAGQDEPDEAPDAVGSAGRAWHFGRRR